MDVRVIKTQMGISIKTTPFVDIDKLSEVQIEPITAAISEAIDRKIGAVKMSGYWLIGDLTPEGAWQSPIYGHRGERTRKFTKALAGALNMAIAVFTPL